MASIQVPAVSAAARAADGEPSVLQSGSSSSVSVGLPEEGVVTATRLASEPGATASIGHPSRQLLVQQRPASTLDGQR